MTHRLFSRSLPLMSCLVGIPMPHSAGAAPCLIPQVECSFTLRLYDAFGDGWDGSILTLCIGANCTDHTVTGSGAIIPFTAQEGEVVSLIYTPMGNDQEHVFFTLSAGNGGLIYVQSPGPPAGLVYSFTVDSSCNMPPLFSSDCIGAIPVCNDQPITGSPVPGFGATQDLDASNRGCLLGNEIRGVWMRFTAQMNGTLAFTIVIPGETDYDFAVWGDSEPPTCPPVGPPIRCNWSAITGPTGLNYTSVNSSEGAGGPAFSRWIDALAGESFLLYVDNWTNNGIAFDLVWNNDPPGLIDCLSTAIPSSDVPRGTLHIQPNPAEDVMDITLPYAVSGVVDWEIADASGRLITQGRQALERGNGRLQLAVSDLHPGPYVVRISDLQQGGMQTAPFIKQ